MEIAGIYGWFFRGVVRFAGQGLINAKYSIVSDGSIIKVKNKAHIRLVPDKMKLPDSFEIIAPTEAVIVMSGIIPDDYIHYLPASEYLRLRLIYHGV